MLQKTPWPLRDFPKGYSQAGLSRIQLSICRLGKDADERLLPGCAHKGDEL